MYQHIQLRRLSNLSSTTTSQKVDGLDALKRKEASDIYDEDDVLVLKELSNKMDELEEVILVEDEPALRLPQLSNESWNDFVEELSKKYEHDDLLSTSVPQSTNAKRKFQIADDTQSLAHRCNVATNNNGVVSISSDEDDNSSTVISEGHMLSSSKDCPSTIEEPPTTNSYTPLAHGENNEGGVHLEEINKLDRGQLNENCATTETERVNNEAFQHSTEPISNIKSGVAKAQNQIRQNFVTASNNSTPCVDNKTVPEHLRSKTSNSSKNKGLTGINKKYQDIKRRTYKLTFHQILQIFDIEKSVPSTIGAIPGEPIELDFPDLEMREFVKIVKNYQMTESAEDVRHLWTQIKSWLCAMKPAYGTTTNYTKYQKKLNWYITELMAQYVKFEIENSIQNENYYKLKMEALMNTASSLLNDDVNLKILTLLRTDFPEKPSNFLDELFKKFLTHSKVRLENNNYGIYRLKVLAFQKWMHYSNRKRQDIVEIAIKEGSAHLPRLLPKNTEDPFYRVDRHVHIIDDYDKQGTRKILEENVSIDVLKATINKYLQVYESQIYDDFGYRLLRRQALEHSQTLAAREDAMQRHGHSPKAITVRSDARHCNRRRTHQIHTHNNNNNNNNNNSSRATHLAAGCDIQRNSLSSSPFRTNRCSCKSLVAKHQSDTSLSCKTPSSNDIISLDSADDEVDNVESAGESTEKSSMNTEKRNQSTQLRIVRRVRPPLQPQTVDNRQINTITQKTRPCQAHALRHRKIQPKKVDTIVLDSSSSEDEDRIAAPVDAAAVNNDVNRHKIDKIDDTHNEEPTTPTAQLQQTQQQQQAARARLQSVSMPLRCALIGSVAIKPIRKEKHCIPGEVSSTTSHDIIETERLNEAPAVSCSGNLVVNNSSAYENAREVGTVEILERRELRQPVVMAERCFQPGKLLLGIDYSDDENEDDVAERSREHIAAGSDAGDDDGVSNGCFIPMVGGYSKVVEEATSSTEVFQRIQSLEHVAAAEALSIVEPAPVVLAGLVDRTALVAAVSADAPTCSKYANSNAMNATVSKENIQKEGANALEFKRGKILKITVKDFASANIIGRRKDTPEDRLREDMESSAPAFGLLAGLGHEDEQQQVCDENEDEASRKTAPLSGEGPKAVSKETQDTHSEPTENDEMAAIDQMLADIDENLRVSHEFNEKSMKAKNNAGVKSHNVAVKLTEHVQNKHDLTNTAVHNLDKNVVASNCEKVEGAAPAKTALARTNATDLFLDVCEPVPELAKSSDVGSEVEANVTVMEAISAELVEDVSSDEYSNEILCEKSVEKLKTVDGQTLGTSNDIYSEENEEVITMTRAESECLNKNKVAFKENSSYLDAACSNISKSTQENYEEQAMDGKVQNNEEIETNQESDILNDICPREVKTLAHLSDNTQTKLCEGSSETEKRQLQDEDTTDTVDLEKNALAITDLQAKTIEDDSGDEFPESDLNQSGSREMNAEDEVEETDISAEVIAEERTKDTQVLVKPVDEEHNGTELTLSERKISSQIDVDQTEMINANINKEVFEVENTKCDSQKLTELVSSEIQANIVTTDLDKESEVSFKRTENVDDEVHDDENVIRNKNAEAGKCVLDTEMVFESRTVVDDTEYVEKDDLNKTREESPKTISKGSDKSNEFAFVEDIENLPTDVTESYSGPCRPTEFAEGNEMVSVDDMETRRMCEPVATDIGEETVATMKDVIKTENETKATLLLENTTTEEMLNIAKEMRTVEPEATGKITVFETLELDLKGRYIEHDDSVSRNIYEESVNKEELTKQSRELVEKLDNCIEEASEMVKPLSLATKDNGSKPHEKRVTTSNGVEELVKDVEQCNDETETTPLRESSTIIQVNEREPDEIESTDIETPLLVVKSKDLDCRKVSDLVTRSNEEEPGNVNQLTNENDMETETEPLETENKINNSHEDKVLTASQIEEVTVVTEENVKDDATNDDTNETSLFESVTKFQVNGRSSDSEDIKNKFPIQLKDVERAEVCDSAPKHNGEQKVLVTDAQISNQDLPESIGIKMKVGFESADVETLPISHEIIVSASKEIEEVVEEELIEELVQTEDQVKTTSAANQELVNNSEIFTEVTSVTNELEITSETTAGTGVVTDDSIEETPSNRGDSLEGEQFTELIDSQTEEFDAVLEDTMKHNANLLTGFHESQKCQISLANDLSPSEDEATDETPSEVEVGPYTCNETNESGIGTEVVESLAGEEITKSVAAEVVEANIESQLKEVSEIENSQKITDSIIEPQEQDQLDEINSNETSVDSTEKCATESEVGALPNSTSDVTPDQCALGNVLPTERFDEDSDQNANISEEKLKVIVESSELEVKAIPKEKPSNNNVSESSEFSTADKQVEETSSVQDLQVDEENIDNTMARANEVVSLADGEESVEEAAITDSIVHAEVMELGITENVLLKDAAKESCLTAQKESDTNKILDISAKTRKADEKQDEIELIAKSLPENYENNINSKDLKSDDVTECEHETADTNSLNNNNTSSVAIDTLLEDATARKLPIDSETVKTCSKQKLKLKSKPHKLIKTDLLEKSTTNSSKKFSKLKAVRNSKKRLLTEDASGKLRFKRRVSPCNDSNKDLDKVEELKKAEELADNIAKLVIKENVEVVENSITQDNDTAETTEQCDNIKQDIDSRSLEDNTEITENQTLGDINAETEEEMLKAEPELSEGCTTFQRLPAEYNSEEILAVATLINMRNKYTSSTYMEEDKVVEMPQEINRDEGVENIEAIVEPGSKKNTAKEGLVKKKVRFDEDNLLELMNKKYKALKKVKKSAKKIEKSRKAEGAILSDAGGGKKYVKHRLLELTTNLSANEADYMIDHIEEVSDLKKKRGRKNSVNAHEEQLNDVLKSESVGNGNPIYPVLLTSRRKSETTAAAKLSKSTKNSTRSLKCDAPTISDIEDVGSDFIVPDDEVEPLCTETYEKPSMPKENILKVSRVCVDGTKIKFKITPKEAIDKEQPVIVEKLQELEASVINMAEKGAIKEKISAQAALMKTRKVTVKLKRMKMPLYATAISKGSIFSSGVQPATLTDSGELDLIVPESPTKFKKREESAPILLETPSKSKKCEELDTSLPKSPTKFKKREESDPILLESPTKSKKHEELDTILSESPTKFKKREEHEPFVTELPNKYKKPKLESIIGSSESNATKSDELFVATGNVLSKSLGKTSHRKYRAISPKKNKKSVKRDISSELSELSTIQDTDNIETLSNAETTNIKNVSIDKLSPMKGSPLESTSLENTGIAENADLLKKQDSSTKITMKTAHKKRPARTSIEEMSPIKDLSLESTSLKNPGATENADLLKNQDSMDTISLKPKKRLAKSPSKTKSLVLPTTCDVSTSKETPNKKTTTIRDASMEKTTFINEISTIKDVTNVQTQELSSSKDSPLAEPSSNEESIVSPEQSENMGVEKIKDSSTNITTKTSRKNRVVKSSFKIKFPISSFTTKSVSNFDELLKEEATIKSSTITKTDTSIEETPIPKESTNRKESALQETSPNKKLRTAQQNSQLERLDIVTNHDHHDHEEYKVSNLSAELVRITPEKTTSLQQHILSDAEIKTEPLEDIQIKEEEDSCEGPLDMAQSYLNVDNRRHAKEFILKPCDVILTEAKINEQADAHRGFRKQRNKKSARVVEKIVPTTTSSNRYKTRRNKATTTEILKSAENVITTENVIPTLEESAPIKELEEECSEQETSKAQKELQAETIKEDMEKSEELQAETRKDDKQENKDDKNSQTAVSVEKEIQQNATPSRADVETEDHASSITDNVIAELKLLSPESLQNTEDDKEQINLILCSENAAIATVADTEKEQETQPTPNVESICKEEKTDEEQKTAQLLDSSIDIVLGNATFTKNPLTPRKNGVSSTPEAVVSNLLQNVTDTVAEVKKPDEISETTPTKNRLDVLTAEKINSVLEKMLEKKNNLLKESKSQATTDSNVRPTIRRQTNTEEEGLRKSSNRSSLNSVKQISAKVPDALFADDESESSNADDSTSDEQFFAPILSLDDLLIKKDEPTADITHTYTSTQEQVVQETDAGQSHDGLGTPNFTVELEVETTQASDENSQSANGNRKVESQSEESGKCVASEELDAHLEETDANFSLSAIADISTIDIPNDLNINNEYPDLLDAMLFEQVRQSIDCMISGTNSAKKWSQDSFATTQAAVNFNKIETAVRTDAPPSAPNTQENDVVATNDKTVTANEDGIGIGQETFLGTISSLDEVEVPTTGFDLVGSFTIADFLSDAGSDLFAFPELDKTQSRSNSFSAESNLCETPPPPAIDTADETSNDKKDEDPIQTPTNHNTNSVACDHSYNKDINEAEKQRTKVRKKSTSSHTSTPTASQSSTKSATSSPLNNSDMLHVFSRAKCLPKPFWKVKRTEELKTSTPKKEEPAPNMQNTQLQTPAVAVKRTITLSPITVKNTEEKQTVFSMPALELVIEQNGLEEEITATSSNNALPEAITNSETETITNLNENISKTVDDVTLSSNPVIETVEADGLEEVLPRMVPNSTACEAVTSLTRPAKRASTPIEITEVITIPAPLIVQPIIRIQSQTNRLERIDPSSSTSQQAFPLLTPESQPNLTDAPNVRQIEVNDISRPERDSTPTLDEPTKDDYELSSPNNSLIVEELMHTSKARQSATQLDEPPAKRLCVENVNKTITTNDIFDMLKSEEKSQKENQLMLTSRSTNKITDLANTKNVESKPKQIEIELPETKASDENLNTNTEGVVCDTSSNSDLISPKVENKTYTQSSKIEEEKNSESSASNQQTVTNPVDISLPKQKYEKLSPSQEPMLISKETLIALRKREHAAKNMSTIMITEHLEQLQPLSPESTPEKCSIEKLKRSPARRAEESKEENIAPITLKITKDLLSQPNQSDDRQQVQMRTKPLQSKNTPSTTKLDPSECSVEPRNVSPVLSNASPCAKTNIDTNTSKTHEIIKTNSPSKTTEKEDVRNTPPIKSHINIKIKDLPIAEVINKSEAKNFSPCQTATASPRTRVPTKPILAVELTLIPQNANRYHPYQRTQTPPNILNTHKRKLTPQRPQSRDSLPVTPENVSNKKRETPKSADKTTPQRIASTVTTLPPLMQSRPTPSHQSTFGTPPTITDVSTIRLTAEDEAEIARKLVTYRTTLPQAKTYGAHKENQRLVNLQEEKLRLECAERASRRLRDTQRLKRKSQPEIYESHYKKFAMHSGRIDATNSSNSSSSSSRSSGSASVGAVHHQSRSKQYPHHAPRPRPHHEYVNKFGEIEKLVEKEKVAKDTESKRSVPLTASTAWEPKMPTGDELIELLSKTKKS